MSDADRARAREALLREIDELPDELRARLEARGFDKTRVLSWARHIGVGRDERNRLTGKVEPPRVDDIRDAHVAHDEAKKLGTEALSRGEVAFCVLAGGMATRMGGVVKALVEALPGKTFLDLRLLEQRALARRFGAEVPFWLMVSEATAGPIAEALAARDAKNVATFEQCVSLRLTPEGGLFRDGEGEPSVYPTGHGDLPEALDRSGLLKAFVARGGKYVWIANLDNLGATIDPTILGQHIASGAPLSVELVDKVGSDRGGGPVRHEGKNIICEEFRLPAAFDPAAVPVFNTNTFIVDAGALHDLDFAFTFVEVEKSVDGKKAIQFERLLGEVTVGLAPHLLRVPRDGARSRFLPVKDTDELARRRPEIEAVLRDRGILE